MLLRAVQIQTLKRVKRTLVYYDTDTQNLRILFGSATCTQQRLLQVARCTSQHTDASQCTKATLTCCWEQYRSKHLKESKEHLFIMTQTHKISEFCLDLPPACSKGYCKLHAAPHNTDASQCSKATLTCCWEQYRSKHLKESKEHLFIMTQTHKISEFCLDLPPACNKGYCKLHAAPHNTDASQCSKATLTCCWEQYRSKHLKESKEHLSIMTQTHKISEFCEQHSYVGTSFSHETNNNDRFTAPHLERAQSTYKDIRICSFYHTHTHAPNTHVTGDKLVEWEGKKMTDQYAEEKRWVCSFELKEESEDECLTEIGREFQITGPM